MVTIDGPAGVGKSTVGRQVALILELPFIDTGIFYRALTVVAQRRGIEVGDSRALAELAQGIDIEVNCSPRSQPGEWQARVSQVRLGRELWAPRNHQLLAFVARQPEVRRALLLLQREPARGGGVLVGRDTGTVVFPDADCKFYLDAPVEVRLDRRRQELLARGEDSSEATLLADVLRRDETDRSRHLGPLRVPPRALAIDTSALSAAEVVEEVLGACRRQGLTAPGEGPGAEG